MVNFFCRAIGAVLATLLPFVLQGQTLKIQVSDIQIGEGKVIVSLYNNENDWFEKPFKEMVLEPTKSENIVAFDIPYGVYAVSVYQDEKENGELDRNFIGIPKEPIAFGNNYKPFGNPDFESASIKFDEAYTVQTLKLYTVF